MGSAPVLCEGVKKAWAMPWDEGKVEAELASGEAVESALL